ncbi:siderophore-interacting protein [Serinicoccus kebangsaanensis]|uniref:siderophore-interacting protein n=1 Tax=Serinicoccus kebangsaanensis TaxID=2602069 RepID=UPI00124D9EE5|nr:siderophore-interacting protein [Serinicoccus kebangsaanensis]
MTTATLQRDRQLHPLHVRRATVSAVEHLGERMRRITLALEHGTPPIPWVRLAVGDHVKVAFPHPETGQLTLPTVVDDRPQLPEGAQRPVTRDYTVRATSDGDDEGEDATAAQRVSIDFVVHGTGPASTWASQASPGDTVGLLGPRGSMTEPRDARRYVCLADETAIPAIGRWLEEAPEGIPLEVVIQVPDATGIVPLPPRDGARVTWLMDEAADTLAQALQALPPAPGDYVWAAGEAGAMVQVRRTAAELGIGGEALAPSAVQVDGYWRRGVAGRDHHQPLES